MAVVTEEFIFYVFTKDEKITKEEKWRFAFSKKGIIISRKSEDFSLENALEARSIRIFCADNKIEVFGGIGCILIIKGAAYFTRSGPEAISEEKPSRPSQIEEIIKSLMARFPSRVTVKQ